MNISDFKRDVLSTVKTRPGLDDEQIADLVGITPFEASKILRQLEAEGKIRPLAKWVPVR